jgi:hypothetical protein
MAYTSAIADVAPATTAGATLSGGLRHPQQVVGSISDPLAKRRGGMVEEKN